MTALNGHHTSLEPPIAISEMTIMETERRIATIPKPDTPPAASLSSLGLTEPASFAAPALKHITTSAKDKRTILRNQLSQYRTTRNELESKFQPIRTQHDLQVNSIRRHEMELEEQLKKLDDYLEGCEMVSQLSHDVASILPTTAVPKPVNLSDTRAARIVRDPNDVFRNDDLIAILRTNVNQPMTAKAIIAACPENKKASAKSSLYPRLIDLVEKGTIRHTTPREWALPQEAPPAGLTVVTAKMARETIEATAPKKTRVNPMTLGAALDKPVVSRLVIAARDRSRRNSETSLGAALKKAGVQR